MMSKFTKTFNLFIYYVLCCSISAVCAYQCVQLTPCSCEYEDGRIIDLHKLSEKSFLQAKADNLAYFFHACSNAKPNLPGNLTISECSVYLLNKTSNNATILGKADNARFSADSNSENYNIIYELNNKTTVIRLACSDYSDPVLYVKKSETFIHNLVLFSENNCPFIENAALSTGSVLVILLCVFTSLYLIGGSIILHLLRGARGREMIPNIDFWSGLPGLVKDGAVFLQNGCKPTISNSETYDRI